MKNRCVNSVELLGAGFDGGVRPEAVFRKCQDWHHFAGRPNRAGNLLHSPA